MDYEKFLLFGDSITEFAFNTRPTEDGKDQYALGAALVNEYTRKMDILQRGFKGYTSRSVSYTHLDVYKRQEARNNYLLKSAIKKITFRYSSYKAAQCITEDSATSGYLCSSQI